MRDATLVYLQKALKEEAKILSTERVGEIFGYGTEDLTISQSCTLTDVASNYVNGNSLEFHNLTIDENCSVLGNNYSDAWRGQRLWIAAFNFADPRYGVSSHVATPVPFFLKVSGTLTVNGHLHMDGQGGGHSEGNHHGNTGAIQSALIYNPVSKGRGWFYGSDCVSLDYWLDFYDYGLAKTYFDGKTNLCGAGASMRASWKSSSSLRTKRKYDNRITSGPINGGGRTGDGTSVSHKNSSGRGSGGFLALYYENLDYQGFNWTDDTNAITKGLLFPANINCNGGEGQDITSTGNRGGGMMVIAAKNIIIGPKGSITCNPARPEDKGNLRLITDQNSTDANIGGGLAFLNRPPRLPDYGTLSNNQRPWQYNGRGFQEGSGCGGVCIGYKIKPEITKPNR